MKRVAGLALLLIAGSALARPPAVRLRFDACLADERAEVERIVGVELGAAVTDAPDAATVALRCPVDDALVEITVEQPGVAGRRRVVDLSAAAPSARARLLALTVAELVSTVEPAPAAVPAPVPVPVPVPVPGAGPSASRLQISAAAVGHGFFAGTGVLLGGGVRLAQELPHRLGWAVDLFAEHGSSDFALGTVAADVIAMDAIAFVHRRWTYVALRGGVGLRGGAVRLDGAPASGFQGATVWGPWLGPLATVGVAAALVRRLAIELAVDGGYVALPVEGRVGGEVRVAVRGPWVGLVLAVGVFL